MSDETKCELIMLGLTILVWCVALRKSHFDIRLITPSTMIFVLVQLIIEIIKHIAVVESTVGLDGHDCLLL